MRPGTVLSSLLTGVLGLQPRPTVVEAAAWLLYAVPMFAYVAWPRRRPGKPRVAASRMNGDSAEQSSVPA